MVSIDVLLDDVLLEIFDFYMDEDRSRRLVCLKITKKTEAWQTLVHVCRRWRAVVFGSPLRLNLELVCTAETPARVTLNVWPPFPLVIWSPRHFRTNSDFSTERADNIIAVLERRNRVRQIHLRHIPTSRMEEIFAAVQGPFPGLTHLWLSSVSSDETGPVIPDSFLGGSAPRLEEIWLSGIPFPGLPKLLLSAARLVELRILNIPHSGYISPEVMATMLSSLTRLGSLVIEFRSPQSLPDQETRRPLTRFVLPVLTNFMFEGVGYYLEYFVARIDAPQLNRLHVTLYNHIVFDTPQFIQFMDRTPKLKALEKGHVIFGNNAASVILFPVSSLTPHYEGLTVYIPCRGKLHLQVMAVEEVFTWSLPPLSALEDLYIHNDPNSRPDWQDNVENALWLELLRTFPAVKNLYLCEEFAPRIMPALQELVGGRTTEVLPTLQNIFLEELQESGPVREGIRELVAARQVTGHPIAVSLWENSWQNKVRLY